MFNEKIKEYYYLHRNNINMTLSIVVVCVIGGLLFLYFVKNKDNNVADKVLVSSIQKEEVSSSTISSNIYVDIKGYVVNEGVYSISNGSRVIDLINLAGGLKEGANTRFINLSKILIDGDVIVIYSDNEIEDAKKNDIIYVETPCVCEKVNNDACIENNTSKEGFININTATKEELMTLSGIGESKAEAIIEYRTNVSIFNSIEDILNVSGISETVFSKIKNLITV